MKFTLVLLIVAAFVACAMSSSLNYSCTPDSWAQYKASYDKNYPDKADDLHHFTTFCDKLKSIEDHNAKFEKGEATFEMGVNQFTDMTNEEIKDYLG